MFMYTYPISREMSPIFFDIPVFLMFSNWDCVSPYTVCDGVEYSPQFLAFSTVTLGVIQYQSRAVSLAESIEWEGDELEVWCSTRFDSP